MKDQLDIALIQSDLYWENPEANLGMFEEKIWQIEGRVDLIILPEMFTTGFTMNAEKVAEPKHTKTYRWMKQQSAQTGAVIVGSYVVNDGGRFYNRLYVISPDGSELHYDKKHLFALAGEAKDYTPGSNRLVFEIQGWKIMPLICYDLRFPVWSRSQRNNDALYEYDLLLYVANWPKPRIQAWDTLLAARAIENISYCAGVNRLGVDGVDAEYVGHSAIYNYKGETKAFSDQEEILVTSLQAEELRTFRERFPFQNDSDLFKL